ncbi:nuclear pore complex protein Nup107-like [Actinia tenebrosa]|uniref:Nuclear pore complex protein n=1 Tax=Actinia tenebrosa TaxID=6105 RepID=A0A6P8J6G8_ACTTE|nr:nuclear pore complex protein Nup107-like [Actinia tenebrosa]
MAATSAEGPRSTLYSVSDEEKGETMDIGEGTSRRTMRSLDASRQSSEFYPRDSTLHYIWQYSEGTKEFDPDKMNKVVDTRREIRNKSEFEGNREIPDQNNEENIFKNSKRRSNIQKSLQLLDDAVGSPKPFLVTATPLLRTAGTPTPLLQRTPMTQLRHSTYTPSGMSSIADTDFDTEDLSMLSNDGYGRSTLTASLSRPTPTPGYSMGSISLMNETGLTSSVTPMKPLAGIADDLTTETQLDTTQVTNTSVLTDKDPIVSASSVLFQEFKDDLVKYPHSTHVFDLVAAYEKSCRNQVNQLNSIMRSTAPGKAIFVKKVEILMMLTQESYTWRLIGSLYSDRLQSGSYDDEAMLTDFMRKNWSEKKVISLLYDRESSTRQNQLVIDWLEKNAEDFLESVLHSDKVEYFSESICWENTLHELREGSKRHGSKRPLVTEMDPDAPVRQNRPLADLDVEDEERLLKHLFVFIRAGKLKEAQELCERCGQAWRAATLEGWKLLHDSNIDGVPDNGTLAEVEGNPYRDVWKACAWKMSNENKFGLYERAVYASFSGNLNQLIPACESWEDFLWAYYKVMIDVRVEQELHLNSRSDRQVENLPSAYWDQNLTPEKIFEELKSCSKESVRRQAEHHHHIIQTHIILDDIQGLLKIMNEWLQDENSPSNHMLRFMAHFVLFLRASGLETQEELSCPLLKAYVQNLIDDCQVPLVATYTATLPPELQIDTYAYFLEEIIDRKERQRCLELAESAGLDVQTITKTVVENIRGKDFKIDNDLSPALEAATTEEDRKKIEAVEWLVFDPSQRAEALKQGNAIMRCFIATRKHTAAREVFNKIPAGSIDVIYKQWQMRAGSSALPAEDDNAIREYLCIKAYLDAHDAFNDWFQHFHHGAPKKLSSETYSNFSEKVALEQRQKQYEVDRERWQNSLEIHSKATVERLYNVLLFPDGGWMFDQRMDGESDATRSQQLELLRQLCLPLICFLLHTVHHSTGQYKQCLQLADIIASEQYELYKVFRKDELQRFLTLLRETSLAVLENSMDPLGYQMP